MTSWLTVELYEATRRRLTEEKRWSDAVSWQESVQRPATAEAMASELVWVITNSGMHNRVARTIFDRIWPALQAGEPLYPAVFGHRGKALAMENIWDNRATLFEQMKPLPDDRLVEWCEGLPWIGAITKYHAAKNLGADVAKPDRWLDRLARSNGETVAGLCKRLADATGDRVATVDLVLWASCADGLLRIPGWGEPDGGH